MNALTLGRADRPEAFCHAHCPRGPPLTNPMCNYLGDGEFESILPGARTQLTVRQKVVDATYFSPSVPSTHKPHFKMAPVVRLMPPNGLPQLWHGTQADGLPRRFVIVGAGKTAMDAAIWLMGAGASPDAITWVMPRDSWLVNRITTQPAPEFFKEVIGGQADQMEACAQATSIDDLYLRLEACGALLRIDRRHMPGMFHLATVSPAEVEVLQRIRQVIRMGRVQNIAADHMLLDQGRVAVAADTLFIDCTASAVEPRPMQPMFQGDRIVPQLVRLPQPAFSAALVAYVEAHYEDDAQKNALCGTVPFPHTLEDYPRALMANMRNQFQWGQDKPLRKWIREARLDGFGKLIAGVDPQDAEKQAIMQRLKTQSMAAMTNLQRLICADS